MAFWDSLKTLLKAKNYELSEEELKKLEAEYPKENNPSEKTEPPKSDEAMQAVLEKINGLSSALAEEKKAREEAVKTLEESRKKELTTKIETKIKEAIAAGKIASDNEDEKKRWTKLFESDFENAEFTLGKIQGKASSADQSGSQVSNTSGSQADASDRRATLIEAAKAKFASNSN